MDVVDVHLRLWPGLHRLHGELGEALRADPDDDLGQQLGVVRFEPDGTGIAPGLFVETPVEDLGDLLVRPVLQQPREQQVPGLQQRQVGLVLDLGGGQQPGRLQVQQGRRDDKELGRLVQVPVRTHRPDVHHELVGDLGQRHLGDIELVLRDQLEKEVERPLEVGEPHLEDTVIGLFRLFSRRLGNFGLRFDDLGLRHQLRLRYDDLGLRSRTRPRAQRTPTAGRCAGCGSVVRGHGPRRLPLPPAKPAYENARVPAGLQIGQDDGDRLAHDAPAVDRETVLAPEQETRVLQVDQFLGGHVHGDLLVVPFPPGGPALGLRPLTLLSRLGRTFLRLLTSYGAVRGAAAGFSAVRVRRYVLGALSVTALGGYGLRGVLPGGGTVALPRRSRHPGLAVGPAPGGGRLKRHPPCRTEQFVGPRRTHSA